jgi:hypothetical protein
VPEDRVEDCNATGRVDDNWLFLVAAAVGPLLTTKAAPWLMALSSSKVKTTSDGIMLLVQLNVKLICEKLSIFF